MNWGGAGVRGAGCFFLLLPLTGCLATQQEIEDLRADISRLQSSLTAQNKAQAEFQSALQQNQETLQGNQADLLSKISDLNRNLDIVSSHLEESDGRMTSLVVRLDDLDKNVSNRLDAVVKTVQGVKSLPAPSPSRLFTAAMNDYNRRKYDQALVTFETYLDQYGDTDRAPQAQYQMGEIHAAQKNWTDALEAYDAVLEKYPKSTVAVSAAVRKGQILETQDRMSDAIEVYRMVVRTAPHRKEAQTARERLAALGEESPKPTSPSTKPAAPKKPTRSPKSVPAPKSKE
jgi:TolA-binding protein